MFEAFQEPRNLARITPAWLRFVIRGDGPLEMRSGLEIDYTIRWLGLPMRWRSVISEYDPPHLFVDEQVIGPYAKWHHRHDFWAAGNDTVVADRVRYSLPFGPLGRIAQELLVKRQLLGIFGYRARAISDLIGADCTVIEAPVIERLR